MMKNIYIVRHGESQGNARMIEQGQYIIDNNISLNQNGIEQAKQAGEILNKQLNLYNGVFWVSPFKRTRETFKHIFDKVNEDIKKYDYIEDPILVEQDFGDFDFQFYEKWKDISPHSYFVNQARYNDESGRFFARLENGENMLDVYNRVSLFVKTRLETSYYHNNIIITHGYASIALTMFLLNLPIESFSHTETPANCSIRHIVYKDGKYIDKGFIT